VSTRTSKTAYRNPRSTGCSRLCTATSDFALEETFGTDGAPGALTDFDVCDTLFAVGHNMPETG